MSIGFVMFFKALIVAIWTALAERWSAARKSRVLQLRQNRKTGVYEARDWMLSAERGLRALGTVMFGATLAWWAVLVYLLV